MKTYRIQVYNNTQVDPTLYLTAMFQYYQKHGVTLNYDITNVNVPVPQSTIANNPLVGNVYVIQGIENLVPQTDHDIVLFFFGYDNWKSPWWYPYPLWGNIPRDDTYMANGKPFINIGYWATDQTVGQRFIHEPMHALAKIFGCQDQMDTYINDANPDSPVGNFASQWAIFQPYLNEPVPVIAPTTQSSIAQSTLDLITGFEGFRPNPYKDIKGNWTIGIGFTTINGQPVTAATQPMTLQQSEAELKIQLQHYANAIISALKVNLNQNQFDACCSLCYNIGTYGFSSSTVVRDINNNNFAGAANAFLLWDIPAVLITRRQKERALFLS